MHQWDGLSTPFHVLPVTAAPLQGQRHMAGTGSRENLPETGREDSDLALPLSLPQVLVEGPPLDEATPVIESSESRETPTRCFREENARETGIDGIATSTGTGELHLHHGGDRLTLAIHATHGIPPAIWISIALTEHLAMVPCLPALRHPILPPVLRLWAEADLLEDEGEENGISAVEGVMLLGKTETDYGLGAGHVSVVELEIEMSGKEIEIPSGGSSEGRKASDLKERTESAKRKSTSDSLRRGSSSASVPINRDFRREGDKPDYFDPRPEAARDKYASRQVSPPPQAPQVPAFGSVTFRSTSMSGPSPSAWRASSPTKPSRAIAERSTEQGPKSIPTGPKAFAAQPPTAPKAERQVEKSGIMGSVEAMPVKIEEGKGQDVSAGQQSGVPPESPAKQIEEVVPITYRSTSTGSEPTFISRAPLNAPQAPSARPTSSSSSQGFGKGFGSASIPTGPSLAISPGRSSTTWQFTQGGQTASLSPSATANATIPTGPRANRPTRGRSNQWIRGGLSYPAGRPKLTSGPVPAKRTYTGEERDQGDAESLPNSDDPIQSANDKVDGRTFDNDTELEDKKRKTESATSAIKNEFAQDDAAAPDSLPSTSRPPNPLGGFAIDEAEDDEEEMDMDEIYDEFESKSKKNIAALQDKMDSAIAHLAEALNFLDKVDSAIDQYCKEPPVSQAVYSKSALQSDIEALPTPKDEDDPGQTELTEDDIALRDIARIRIPTPRIEDLPFLNSGPPTPVSDMELVHENLHLHEKVKGSLAESISRQRQISSRNYEHLRNIYADMYRQWRAKVEFLDHEAKQTAVVEPEQAPPPPEMPSLTPAQLAPTEGRRGGKFSSELDIQRLLKETELAAKEEQDKADREAKAKVDTAKEAVIPDMLDDVQSKVCIFRDSNQILDGRLALATFNFLPPEDDFTEEEHALFIENFISYPKKWGKIADALPNRNYQQCIQHYYLTKDEAKYKEKGNKSKKRKGRRGGISSSTRPKSNALMSDLGVHPDLYEGDEFEAPTIAVTDTGRPRRAAAPTFGDVSTENDSNTPAATPGRRAAATPKADANMENPMERTGKRGRTGLSRGGPRTRGKTQLLAAAPTPSPQKVEKVKEREISKDREVKDDDQRVKDLEGAQLLAGLQASQAAQASQASQAPRAVVELPAGINFDGAPPPMSSASPSREVAKSARPPKTASTTSSYWSVPECADFPKLLDHFGTDWQAIALHMSSKTSIMVKNFYNRELHSGRTEWKDRAAIADAKITRGESMGPPPATSTLPKRRYETPQPSLQRTLAPSVETIEIEDDSPRSHASMPVHHSPPQYPPSSKYPTLAQATTSQSQAQPLQPASAMPPRSVMPSHTQAEARASQPTHGPRAGYFTEARGENRPVLQAQPAATQQAQTQFRPEYHSSAPQQQPPAPSRYSNTTQAPTRNIKEQVAPVSNQTQPVLQARPAPVTTLQQEQRHQPSQQVQSQHQQGHHHPAPQQLQQQVSSRPPPSQQHPPPPRQSGDSHHAAYSQPPSQPQSQPSASIRPPMSSSPPQQEARPRSVPGQVAAAIPPAVRAQEPRKTSSIMALLNNNEPEEPAYRKRMDVGGASSPAPSQAPQPPIYSSQAPPSTSHPLHRPENPESQAPKHPYERPALASANWYTRPQYPSSASSPQPQQPTYAPPPQPAYQPLRTHTPPAQAQYAHSRGPSYTERPQPNLVHAQHQARAQQQTPPPGHHYNEPPRHQYQPPIPHSAPAPQHQVAPHPPPPPQQQPMHPHSRSHSLQNVRPQQQQAQHPHQPHPHPQQAPQTVMHGYAPQLQPQQQHLPPQPPPPPQSATHDPQPYTPGTYHHRGMPPQAHGYEQPPPRSYDGRERR
ncbi:MAG: hypothetical protein M1833_003347 [Piccolia ochrophora]|nr:MAG: hypothetical protein M1833_003347 [Piccolia ochrophora]